jgi:hypothetical protein
MIISRLKSYLLPRVAKPLEVQYSVRTLCLNNTVLAIRNHMQEDPACRRSAVTSQRSSLRATHRARAGQEVGHGILRFEFGCRKTAEAVDDDYVAICKLSSSKSGVQLACERGYCSSRTGANSIDDAQQMMQQWLIGNAGRLDDRCMEGRDA